MDFKNIAREPNTVRPPVAQGNTSIDQPPVEEADALLKPVQKLYWEYLVWQAQKAIEELEAAEFRSLPAEFQLCGKNSPRS